VTLRSARVLVAVAAAAVLAATAAPATAHSALQRSDPADGDRLEAAPAEIVLVFSEPPDPQLSRVDVLEGDGQPVGHDGVVADDDGATVRVALPPLDDGLYTVSWQALSAVDGHVTRGAFSFAVGDIGDDDAAAAAPADDRRGEGPSLLAVIGRWVLYWGLALLFGWALSRLLVFRPTVPGPAWLVIVCWTLAAAGLVIVVVAEAASVDVSVGRLLASSAGTRLVRLAGVLLAAGVAAAIAAAGRGAAAASVLAVLTAAAMLAHTAAGHAGAPTSSRWLNLSAQWLHLVAIGAWIGGLVWLLAGMRDRSTRQRVASVTRFSTLATFSLGLVVVTGVVRAVDGIGTLEALRSSGYGRALLVKVGLIVPLVALGGLNRFRNVPAIARGQDHHRSLRNTVRGEVTFAAAVFGVAAVLSTLPPPADVAAHQQHAAEHGEEDAAPPPERGGIDVTGSDLATSVRVTLRIEPGVVGENRFSVRVADYDTDETIDASRVALDFSITDRPEIAPARLELEPAGSEWWEATGTTIAQPGRWRANTTIAHGSEGVEVPLEFEVGADTDHDGGGDTLGH
jgi:copper transport protein